jgi:hypothetical protein
MLCQLSIVVAYASQTSHPDVVYAQRYSKEFKYRPAASPIVTERLKDGRTRVRGAQPQIIQGYQYQ